VISRVSLNAERKGIAPPGWIKPVIILSIPWAISIHTVTAFIYSGLEARPFWMTAVLAPRFLASAFASGPALLILICLALRKLTRFDVGDEPIKKLAQIVTYGMIANVFLVAMELFTAFYSDIPEHIHHFEFLFVGLEGQSTLVPWMWVSALLTVGALAMLLWPGVRQKLDVLPVICGMVIVGIWIDKGMGMVVAGFVPNPVNEVVSYAPTLPEVLISLGIYAMGALILLALFKVAIGVREAELPQPALTEEREAA
jgi:Ni/Fe-hydrogenase subunit HybB-like protein